MKKVKLDWAGLAVWRIETETHRSLGNQGVLVLVDCGKAVAWTLAAHEDDPAWTRDRIDEVQAMFDDDAWTFEEPAS